MPDRITDSKSSGMRGVATIATIVGAVAVGAFAIGGAGYPAAVDQ